MKTVAEVMYTGPENAVVNATDCLRDALEEMSKKSHGAVCVVEEKKLVGLLTDGDLRRILLNTQKSLPQLFLTDVSELMVKDPKRLQANASLPEALEVLQQNRFWVIPVVNEQDELQGLVHLHTLLKLMQ
jgi:arabinose-5-phosphate isomerase